MKKRVLAFAIFIFSTTLCLANVPTWVTLDHELNSEPNAQQYQAAIDKLKNLPSLEAEVIAHLDGDSPYLSEAISITNRLKKKNLISRLLELLAVDSIDLSDKGSILSTLNNLSDQENGHIILSAYKKNYSLTNSKISSALRLATIDFYEKNSINVTASDLKTMLRDPSHQLRIESVTLAAKKIAISPEYHDVIKQAILLEPYQLRLHAVQLLSEMPKKYIPSYRKEINSCAKDQNEMVRKACKELE